MCTLERIPYIFLSNDAIDIYIILTESHDQVLSNKPIYSLRNTLVNEIHVEQSKSPKHLKHFWGHCMPHTCVHICHICVCIYATYIYTTYVCAYTPHTCARIHHIHVHIYTTYVCAYTPHTCARIHHIRVRIYANNHDLSTPQSHQKSCQSSKAEASFQENCTLTTPCPSGGFTLSPNLLL